MNGSFWKGKKVFITGHTGFKGSWLSLWLQKHGALLTGYALAPDKKLNLFDTALVEDGMKSIIGDIRDSEKLNKIIKNFSPDIIIHMAAQPLVRSSYQKPLDTYSTNVIGTLNILESLRINESVKVFLNVTTDKCYENREQVSGYSENDPMGGDDPYSNSKACSELITKAYRSSFFNKAEFVKIASARSGNVIGGGDWAKDRLIPDIIRSITQDKTLFIRNPKALRPWQFVLEPLAGYLLLIEKLYLFGNKYAEAWNFGPEDTDLMNVRDIVGYINNKWGSDQNYIEDKSAQFKETQILKLNIKKAKEKLGWKPKWNLSKALDSTIYWYNSFVNKKDMRNITLKQISEFENF
jgi:CDP-glucose 4,6-dehydratase